MKNIGFIGMGNMAKALASGFISSGKIDKESIYAYAPNYEKLCKNASLIGFKAMRSLKDMVTACDTLIMACKPYQIETVLAEIGPMLKGKALLSIASGWDYAKYAKLLDKSVRIQFIMPNTPAMVLEGVMLFEKTGTLDDNEKEKVKDLFSAVGLVEELPTELMGIGSAITGCAPAFVDLFMESYADAAVKYGIPRQTAYRLIAQMVQGSAKLMGETGEHPGALKDAVCSPGGTTIRGIAALEENGFRNSCIKSVDAVMNFKND